MSSICVIHVELIDDRRIATSSRLLHVIPLSRLLFMSFTMVNRSSKSEWNIYLSMPPHFFMSLENLIINITHFYMQCYKNCSLQKLLFRDDCDLKEFISTLFSSFFLSANSMMVANVLGKLAAWRILWKKNADQQIQRPPRTLI